MASPGGGRRSMEDLPDNVLSNIFIRLLAKEAAQMRSVSKSWNALISHSFFVNSHLHHSIQNNDVILLFFDMIFSFDRSTFTARPSSSPDVELTNNLKLPMVNSGHKKGGCFLIGSANGLICFACASDRDYVIYIWNPSLSAFLTLPPCSWSSGPLHYGFGFDPNSDDYKLVKIRGFSQELNMVPQSEVYSMRKGSWELITQRLPWHITLLGSFNQVCVDDHLHWISEPDLEGNPQTIVAFDLDTDTFMEMPLPNYLLHHHENRSNVLGVLSGKLCVMSCVEDGECEVWVMDEYGVADSWVKHHVFPPFSGNVVPYGFTSKGEFIFQVDQDDHHFGLYDPVEAKTKTCKIMSRYFSIKMVEYVDSLVWIEPGSRLQI